MIRVLIAVEPFERRQTLSCTVRRRRPGARMLAIPPEESGRKASRRASRRARPVVAPESSSTTRAAADPDVRGPRTWTIRRDEMACLIAAVDETKLTRR